MRIWLISILVALALTLGLVAGALIAASLGGENVPSGVSVAGVDVSGLSETAARARLATVLEPAYRQPIVVQIGDRSFKLVPSKVESAPDLIALAAAAVRRNHVDPFARAWRKLTSKQTQIPVNARIDMAALKIWSEQVAATVGRPARDAAVHPTADSLHLVSERAGQALDPKRLALAVEDLLLNPQLPRRFAITPERLSPQITLASLVARYPRYILVDRAHYRLRLFVNLKLFRSYPIAVGRAGLETPSGLYHVNEKVVNPPWVVPNLPWAGSLAGKVIPPGPNDPIKARWIGFVYGSGIHGTDVPSSIGHSVSHGCIRMTIPNVIDLFKRVPMGTPVQIT